jgi:hypothetical protein
MGLLLADEDHGVLVGDSIWGLATELRTPFDARSDGELYEAVGERHSWLELDGSDRLYWDSFLALAYREPGSAPLRWIDTNTPSKETIPPR